MWKNWALGIGLGALRFPALQVAAQHRHNQHHACCICQGWAVAESCGSHRSCAWGWEICGMVEKWLELGLILLGGSLQKCKSSTFLNSAQLVSSRPGGQQLTPFEAKIHLDNISFNSVISCCERSQQWQQANWQKKVLELTVDRWQVTVLQMNTEIMFPHCMNSHKAHSQKWGLNDRKNMVQNIPWTARDCQAIFFLEAMVLARLSPDVISFNGAMSACGKISQWPHAMSILEDMSRCEVQPDATWQTEDQTMG